MKTERSRLVRSLQDHLEQRGRPRAELFVIVSLSGIVGFLTSFALLSGGINSMAVRYGFAGGAAYLAFLGLLGVYARWMGRQTTHFDPIDAVDAVNFLDAPSFGRASAADAFAGGRSGGGGAAAAWGDSGTSSSHAASSRSGGGSWFDGDLDAGWVLIAIGAALVGLLAVGYVVWIAPALLAEVLVDAVIVSTVSRHVGLIERRDWTATAVRRTWIPATLVIVTLILAGWALQQVAPDAKSIGPALRAMKF